MENLTPRFTPEEHALNARLLAALPPRDSIRPRERDVDYEIVEMAVLFREGELTSQKITQDYLDRITDFNGTFETYDENGGYNAFVRIDRMEALEQARLADEWLKSPDDERGPAPPLCGIPMGVKDSIGIHRRESTNGSEDYRTNVALKDATCVAKLRAQGTVLLGHNMCSEYSGSTHGDFDGSAWDPARVPGGSSSGSGIAPIARLCAASLGEETGGSLVFPASANGSSAIKPSLGLVSTAGLMDATPGWDVIGPMARSARDASLILALIAGVDQANDPLTLSATIPGLVLPTKATIGPQPLEGLVIGIPQNDRMTDDSGQPPAETYDADYRSAFERFKDQLSALGAEVIEFPGVDRSDIANCPYSGNEILIDIEYEPGQSQPLTPFTVTSYCNKFAKYVFQAVTNFALTRPPEPQARLLSQYRVSFFHAVIEKIPLWVRIDVERRRRQEQAIWQQALNEHNVDFMLVLQLGSHIGLRFPRSPDDHGLQNRRIDIGLPNNLGWPMVTFPIGYGSTGVPLELPITAAFWGPRFSEVQIIQAAIDFQSRHPEYHNAAPPDPIFGPATKRPAHMPRVRELTAQTSCDPAFTHGRSL